MTTTTIRPHSTRARLPARPGAPAGRTGARSAITPARIELEVTHTLREQVATMVAHREASRAAFEGGDRVRANRLRQQGQHITHMADQINLARKGLASHHDVSAHLENVGRIYDDLAELRKRIDGNI